MDQLAEISLEGAPQMPAATGNARADALARAEHFKELTAFFEKGQSGFAERGKVTAEPVQPISVNEKDLDVLRATQADALKRFNGNAQVNAIIDQAYRDLHNGKRLDHDAMSAALAKATETSDDRATAAAVDELLPHVDADGMVGHDKIPQRLLSGYSLPPGQYAAEQSIALLATARELGLSQDQVDRFIELQDSEHG